MITVRLENQKGSKLTRGLPKAIFDNDGLTIHECPVEQLIDMMDESDSTYIVDSIEYILRNERMTLAERQHIVDKVIAIINFYKNDKDVNYYKSFIIDVG